MTFSDDNDLFDFMKKHLYVAAVCDILDELGFRDQVMHQRLRPLLPDIRNCGFAGRALNIKWMETDYVDENDPYGLEIEALDSSKPGSVIIHSRDSSGTNAPWGELMTTIAIQNGVVGCVCDSQIRDCVKIIDMNFPVYYTGIRPLDSKGRGLVVAYNVPVNCGEVIVYPDDLIFADYDGIVVVPRKIETEVIAKAAEKIEKENKSRKELQEGRSLREVYDKYQSL